MALLIKEIVEEVQYITEANEKGEKNYYIEGIIMQGDIKNRNGRIYPSNVLVREMNRYNENYVSKNRAFGELGHPQGPTINLDRVSHLFTELKAGGSNVVGKAKITKTPMGDVVKGLIDSGAQLGISSRGMGSVKPNKQGIMEVQNDFMLATAGDIVADPSAPDAREVAHSNNSLAPGSTKVATEPTCNTSTESVGNQSELNANVAVPANSNSYLATPFSSITARAKAVGNAERLTADKSRRCQLIHFQSNFRMHHLKSHQQKHSQNPAGPKPLPY